MATLRELLHVVRETVEAAGAELQDTQWHDLEGRLRMRFARERVYIPPIDSRKQPGRRAAISDAARRLPTGIAAARFGVSTSYVYRVAKKK